MNWLQFLAWVNTATFVQLQTAYAALGLPALAAGATEDDYRNALRLHASAQPDLMAAVPPALAAVLPPTPPAPAPAPAPAGPARWLLPVAGLIAVGVLAALAIGSIALARSGGDNASAAIDKGGTSATATATASPAATATTAPSSSATPAQGVSGGGACHLITVGPWSENNGGPFRIEVGGGNVQHIDFYPIGGEDRVPTISYIVPPLQRGGVAMKWFGYGQMWQSPGGPECANFDFVKDAIEYATGNSTGQPGRIQQGHSGLVIDLRGGTPRLVANVNNWSEAQIRDLLDKDNAAQGTSPVKLSSFQVAGGGSTQVNPSTQGQPSVQAPASGNCTIGQTEKHNPTKDQVWRPGSSSDVRVVNIWSNATDPNWDDHGQPFKWLLLPGQNPGVLGGGGDVTSWPAGCEDAARKGMAGGTEIKTDQIPSNILRQ